MTDPILVAATELKDAIDSVRYWQEALIKYLKEEKEYIKDKVRLHMLLQVLEGESPSLYESYDEALDELKDVATEITTFAKEEGYK